MKETLTVEEVYKVCVQENGCALTKDALHEAAESADPNTLRELASFLKSMASGCVLTKDHVKRAIREIKREEKKEGAHVEVEDAPIRADGVRRFSLLKEKVPEITQIIALKEEEASTVFGIIRETDGHLEVEDEGGSVRIGEVLSDGFLSPGVCVGLKGVLRNKEYTVEEIVLPWREEEEKKEKEACLLFFSGLLASSEEIERIKEIVKGFEAAEVRIAAVVLMLKEEGEAHTTKIYNTLGILHPLIKFIVIGGETEIYPSLSGSHRGNVFYSGNPSSLRIGGRTLLVGAFEVTDGIRGKYKVKGEYRKELARVILSNGSFNPFVVYGDLSYTEEYSGVVIGDKYDTFVHKENGKAFGMCGSFKRAEEHFLFYNAEENDFEISSLLQ
ncbi:hypothetical protein NEFER03_1212 [Nematocida sp. LUAm3]|nr:hypothetical protein NEFER03_1212 [Nematocida sp. LUAm3]KAI5175821.1 hypothetical protein NEFER02_1690 [Nematocida sp. LUAm2]KAI5178317.1 hypothetical protein NEFER01_1484 [Nematocida sp. LUAm1]